MTRIAMCEERYVKRPQHEDKTLASRVLLIEDDMVLAENTRQYLENYGFDVVHKEDGESGLKSLLEHIPDVILLDLMLPKMDGWEVCRQVRQEPKTADVPILMLTARGDETDRVVGLEMGADDYLTKPYSLRELVARVRAILRRAQRDEGEASQQTPTRPHESLQVGQITIDRRTRHVTVNETPVELTATEFELLWVFLRAPEQVFSREQLLERVRGREFEIFDRSVDMHISKLRKKLEQVTQVRQIKTVWGVGYRFLEKG